MKECRNFQEIIQSYLAGEIPPSEVDSLRRHCEVCSDCRALMDLHIEMSELGEYVPEPDEADFRSMRSRVMTRIASEPRPVRHVGRRWDFGSVFRFRPAVALPTAAVLLVAAVLVGRWSAAPRTPYAKFSDDILVREVTRQASQQAGLEDYWDTPFSYANVSAKPAPGGNLELSFDVCRHVNMVTPADSPVAREVLLHAILSPASMGTRIRAMEMAPTAMDPKLEEALVYTMHNDPDLAVRLEAMSVLTRVPYNDGVQDALMTTLRRDESVQMRLLALERLAENRVRIETLRRVIDESNMESNPAVMQHAIELTRGAIDGPQD